MSQISTDNNRLDSVAWESVEPMLPLYFRGSWTLRSLEAIAILCAVFLLVVRAGSSHELSFDLMIGSFITALALLIPRSMCSNSGAVLGIFTFCFGASLGSILQTANVIDPSVLSAVVAFVALLMFIHECGIEVVVSANEVVERQRYIFKHEIAISKDEVEGLTLTGTKECSKLVISGKGKKVTIATPRLRQTDSYLGQKNHKVYEDWIASTVRLISRPMDDPSWADRTVLSLGSGVWEKIQKQLRDNGHVALGPLHISSDRVVVILGDNKTLVLKTADIKALQFTGERIGLFTQRETVVISSNFPNSAFTGIVLGLTPRAPGVYFRSSIEQKN